jgi:hypothetical protein
MNDETGGNPSLWLPLQDELGRPKDPAILSAAQHNWTRVLAYARRQGQDASVAADVMEGVAGAVASLKLRRPQLFQRINNLEVYLFWAAIRRLNKLAAKEPFLEYVGSLDDLNSLAGLRQSSSALDIENQALAKELMGFLSERIRFLFSNQAMGYKWPEIAESMGTTALRLRVQFSEGIAAARKRILGKAGPKRNPKIEPGRPK